MSTKPKVKIEDISYSPLFAGVPSKVLKKVPSMCFIKEYSVGSTIISEGEIGDFMFIILEGRVDVLKGNRKNVVATLGRGTFLGEGALIGKAPRNATIIAKDNVKLAVFDQEGFNKLSVLHPSILVTLVKAHNEYCKSTVRGVSIAKSKDFILMAVIGLILFAKNSHSVLPDGMHGFADQLSHSIPDQIMALGGPAAIAIGLKLKRMEMGNILNKLEKI